MLCPAAADSWKTQGGKSKVMVAVVVTNAREQTQFLWDVSLL